MLTAAPPALTAAVAGALTGHALHGLLARRGAAPAGGWCTAGSGVTWAAAVLAARAGALDPSWVAELCVLGALAVVAGAADARHGLLPNVLTLPASPLLLTALVPLGTAAVVRGVAGAAALGGACAAVHLAAPGALGAGDVKLAAALGVPLAAASWVALLAAPVPAAALVLVGAALSRRRSVPYGPALLAAAVSLTVLGAVGP